MTKTRMTKRSHKCAACRMNKIVTGPAAQGSTLLRLMHQSSDQWICVYEHALGRGCTPQDARDAARRNGGKGRVYEFYRLPADRTADAKIYTARELRTAGHLQDLDGD